MLFGPNIWEGEAEKGRVLGLETNAMINIRSYSQFPFSRPMLEDMFRGLSSSPDSSCLNGR